MRVHSSKTVLFLLSFVFSSCLKAEEAQVIMFGVFHFANPGLDEIKTDQINVMSDENQQYLEDLTDRLAEFQATHVLLECSLQRSEELNDQYNDYLANAFELSSNETFQLGFRIARKAGLERVHCYDERDIGWDADNLFEYIATQEPATQAKMDTAIAEFTNRTTEDHRTKSLGQLLLQTNSEEEDMLNKSFYLMTNSAGAGTNFYGADAAASWWHRNFRMYANIQKLAMPDTRSIVIGGQGHTAILKDLLQIDDERQAVDIVPFLRD